MAESGLVIIKLVFIVFIAVVAFVAGILPNKIQWCKKSTDFLGIANAFSGGVFLAIAFLHIMPEATAAFAEFMEEHEHDHWHRLRHGDDEDEFFPLPFALAFAGYAFILLIDKVIFDTHSLMDGGHGHHHGHGTMVPEGRRNEESDYQKLLTEEYTGTSMQKNINSSELVTDDVSHLNPGGMMTTNEKFVAKMTQHISPKSKVKRNSKSFSHSANKLDDDQSEVFTDKAKINLNGQEEENFVQEEEPKKGWQHILTPLVLMIALSAHSVFEGIATGLSKEIGNLWTFVIAIGAHKWAAAMSLGISMSKNFKNEVMTMYIILIVFSLATPVGILIGMAISNASDIMDIIFSSLAAGTFVYIACSEVIVEEFSIKRFKWFKMLAFMAGASLITVLGLME